MHIKKTMGTKVLLIENIMREKNNKEILIENLNLGDKFKFLDDVDIFIALSKYTNEIEKEVTISAHSLYGDSMVGDVDNDCIYTVKVDEKGNE